MPESFASTWRRLSALLALLALSLMAACGGGNTNISNAPTGLEAGNATDLKTVLAAVPAAGGGGGGGGGSNTVRLRYNLSLIHI